MTRHLWIPPADRQKFVCRMPVGSDEVCGHVCESQAQLDRHLRHCVARNEQAMHEARLESRIPMLEHPDPEVERHMKAVGRRMLEERRWIVKPSEKAGF